MIQFLLSVILVILILVFLWRMFFSSNLSENKRKVKFSDDVEEIKEKFTQKQSQKNTKSSPRQAILDKLAKTYDQINPSNFYTQNYNTPNFTSDTMKLPTFYAYLPNADAASKPIPKEPFNEPSRFENFSNQMIKQDASYDIPWNIKEKQTPTGLEYQSDYWSYSNEVPMNGGDFGGIVGYENMGEAYSLFYAKNSNDIVEEQEALLKMTDDLRNGMGTPQKQKYNYNMSNP